MIKAIAYYRVSTKHQKQSGLGLEVQENSVRDYAITNSIELVKEYVEIESGRNNKRPILRQALTECEKEKAVLLIAKLDRLSRSISFLAALMETKAEFIALDMPHADKFFIHVMGAVAQYQAEESAKRTKAALKAAKERGTELGKNGKYVLSQRNRKAADDFAITMHPVIERLKSKGFKTVRQISKELNRRRIPTFYGTTHKWHLNTVHQILNRINNSKTIIT